jgi:manganese-transporting P-type ATPase
VWGPNKLDIPIPTFFDIYKEHLVAPFFVFQIFCSGLWLLDEYWYYSLFTLGMLFVFEGTVVTQRLQNMKRLRSMRIAPFEVQAYRFGRWVKLQTDELYPGEVILLRKIKTDKKFIVPLDLLLLSGSAVVNESILTGESQPLVKECIAHLDEVEEALDIKGQHRVHVLNGGTEVLQFIPNEEAEEFTHIPKAPAPGLICFVLKNGFETKQGKLMRTILFSTERVTVESTETYFYLLILLCFALSASYYVLTEGLKDPDRSRQKLLLRCILIITNVVPPELPMELSMAVNYSIIQLVKKAIFCTEPFRIPFAGKVDVCCFDKTGTLTQNDLVIKGVTGLGDTSAE